MSVTDEAVERLFRSLESALDHDDAVTLVDLLGWRATDALDRSLGRDWR